MLMMYTYYNNVLLPAMNDLYTSNSNLHYYSTIQNKTSQNICFLNINIHVYAKECWKHKYSYSNNIITIQSTTTFTKIYIRKVIPHFLLQIIVK